MDAFVAPLLSEAPAAAVAAQAVGSGAASWVVAAVLWRAAPFGAVLLVLSHVRRARALLAAAGRR